MESPATPDEVETTEVDLGTVTVPRDLVEATLQVLLSAPVGQVYSLFRRWDEAVPQLIVPAT